MKKIILYTILMCFCLSANSQKVKVKSIKKLKIEEQAWFPDFGKNRNEILLSGMHYKGLSLYNVRKKDRKIISESAGAGSDVYLDPKGNIYFRETSIQDGRKSKSYYKFDPYSEEKTSLNQDIIPERIEAIVKGREIKIVRGDEHVKSLVPVKDRNFIWASISPDGKKILFTAAGDASYICDFNGEITAILGYLNAPEWINNDWVIGMDDKDNGEIIISSDLIAVHVGSTKRFNLTNKFDPIAQYPKASPDAKKIVFHSPEGEIYMMKFKLK